MSELTRFDAWLKDGGPAALVTREHLVPVEGPDGVVFPATFAPSEDKKSFAGGYNIDVFPEDKEVGRAAAAMLKAARLKPTIDLFPASKNVCLIDSVGSQANRIEPMFGKEPLAELVPQITVKAGGKVVNLLEAGHRAGDAIVRCSELQDTLRKAFQAVLKGDAEPMAKVAPTSLVFGVWDSRDTQAKLPRLLASTIRAYDVAKLTRSAQYVPAIDYIGTDEMDDPGNDKALQKAQSERGFAHVPASASHGGVIANGGIRRDATLSLSALRLLAAGKDVEKTHALRRYVLGLALVAFTARQESYLRQGCNLVPDIEKPAETNLVHGDGKREATAITADQALTYAKAAAKAFGVGESKEVAFDKKRALADIKGENTSTSTKGARAKKKADKPDAPAGGTT